MSRLTPDKAAWSKTEVEREDAWLLELTPAQIEDLENARSVAASTGLAWQDIRAEHFPLGPVTEVVAEVKDAIRNGRGLAVIRGVPVERYTLEDLQVIYWGIGSHLGTGMPQYRDGSMIGYVRDIRNENQSMRVRGSLTSENLAPHTDATEVVGLFCVRKARSGGMSTLVSSVSVFHAIAQERPDLLEPLLRGFRIYRRGEGYRESEGGLTEYRIPVFDVFENRVSSLFIPAQIEQAIKEGMVVSDAERAALAYLNSVTLRPELQFNMLLEPGDMQFINNLTVYHSRTDFVDFDEPDRKRLLFRLWLNLDGDARCSPDYADIAKRRLLEGYGSN